MMVHDHSVHFDNVCKHYNVRTHNGLVTVNAVDELKLSFRAGEVVGLIGHNGAGKTTMLRLIDGIIKPTSGMVRIRGRVGAMLDIGAGLQGELNGKDNILLKGFLMGMRYREVMRVYESIVALSGIGSSLNVPVKYYSSGMQMRLAFSIAIHTPADIFLIDEALVVGDADFQTACSGRLAELRENGKIVFLITHEMAMVQDFCNRVIVLDKGKQVFDGSVKEGIARYSQIVAKRNPEKK
jgi:ABC-type polysaccharide/polyol phosphate transport system ATPase subunit